MFPKYGGNIVEHKGSNVVDSQVATDIGKKFSFANGKFVI